jgi:hypothetical protein
MTEDEVAGLVRETIKEWGSMRAWCAGAGISSGHVSEFLNGIRGPSTEMLIALGLEAKTEYVRISEPQSQSPRRP